MESSYEAHIDIFYCPASKKLANLLFSKEGFANVRESAILNPFLGQAQILRYTMKKRCAIPDLWAQICDRQQFLILKYDSYVLHT